MNHTYPSSQCPVCAQVERQVTALLDDLNQRFASAPQHVPAAATMVALRALFEFVEPSGDAVNIFAQNLNMLANDVVQEFVARQREKKVGASSTPKAAAEELQSEEGFNDLTADQQSLAISMFNMLRRKGQKDVEGAA